MGQKWSSGRWYDKTDPISKSKIIVINKTLKEKLFGKADAVGQMLGDNPKNKKYRGNKMTLKMMATTRLQHPHFITGTIPPPINGWVKYW
jgi:hypothetical protein